MKEAFSMYEARTIPASEGNHEMAKELGLVCPFETCKESVFWVKPHKRGDRLFDAYWSHYPMSVNSRLCENKCLTKEGREEIKQLQLPATRQRLKLYNRRFWEIFIYEKYLPENYMEQAKICGDLTGLARHCRERWDVTEIKKHLPEKIRLHHDPNYLTTEAKRHLNFHDETVKEIWNELVNDLVASKFTPLRIKILNEVLEWIKTRTAKDSFKRLIAVSFLDCLSVINPPVHSSDVANMAVQALISTDWEKAIAHVKEKYKK